MSAPSSDSEPSLRDVWRRPLLAIGAAIVLTPIALFSAKEAVNRWLDRSTDCDSFSFSKQVWKPGSAPRDVPAARWKLANGLVDCGRLRQLDRRAVLALLGRPLEAGGNDWIYAIGAADGDDAFLSVTFGADATSARIL